MIFILFISIMNNHFYLIFVKEVFVMGEDHLLKLILMGFDLALLII
jgi:hypothetical protein